MEAAKESVKRFISKDGKHDTTLHEKTAPAVQNETISRTEQERQTVAVDREVHQDHYHTTEQPINHSEVLPEQHHHKVVPVVERSFEHHDDEKLKRSLDEERKQYRDTQTRVEGERTKVANPTVAGEHVHHHVHETIQPVIHKQTVEPHVVHTTVPIHEVHHNQAQHHAATSLPPISMEDFKTQGGSLGIDGSALPADGSDKNTFYRNGEPREIRGHQIGPDCDSPSSHHLTGRRPDDVEPQLTNGTSLEAPKKPSLLDRLNPKKDADGDGKAGFMK